jgi:hypothetical protein
MCSKEIMDNLTVFHVLKNYVNSVIWLAIKYRIFIGPNYENFGNLSQCQERLQVAKLANPFHRV